ncbi:type IV toxin-antitoxin system AbiEi family antitoxin domain-containing protein [Mesorhizobium sp. L-8-3]|uniref:type IV toxin-antitoxin system AbiEi family antitoxin domain-containing protein n=1 Tax=Mesorhizobium sp. L-8-3 TaxID=2744522 RepID=UPI00313DAE84
MDQAFACSACQPKGPGLGQPARLLRVSPRRRTDRRWLPEVDETEKYEFAIALRQDAPQPQQVRKRDRDRAEALRLAGGPPPSLRDRAVALARERGEVRTAELTAIGIPRCYLSRMCDEGLLVKIGYGRYRAAEPEAA